MNFKKALCLSACAASFIFSFSVEATAQRDRVVRTTSSRPTNLPSAVPARAQTTSSSRPVLTNEIVVRSAPAKPLVQKTASSQAIGSSSAALLSRRSVFNDSTTLRLDQAIKSRYGIPYRLGSTGPNAYDCSGFVWAAFQEAGINFTRQSARSLWSASTPVDGDERYKFGTLVFLNGLGHVGIVADENGFYHASSSKGITYSPFKGYWANRIVGFRRMNADKPVIDVDER
jgi:cell wall-associated NlpC family hydrolase